MKERGVRYVSMREGSYEHRKGEISMNLQWWTGSEVSGCARGFQIQRNYMDVDDACEYTYNCLLYTSDAADEVY